MSWKIILGDVQGFSLSATIYHEYCEMLLTWKPCQLDLLEDISLGRLGSGGGSAPNTGFC